MQISIVNGSVEYDGEPILTEINFTLNNKEKVAIVGRNGCGKTTLLKAISGEVELVPGTGTSDFSFSKTGGAVIGTLKQSFDGLSDITLEDELLSAYAELLEIEDKIKAYTEKLSTDSCEKTVNAFSRLNEDYERLGGYTYKKEYHVAAKAFGFSETDLKKPLCEFSGGQRTKIALLTLLLSKPEVLLLDEPTNHLDLEAIEWLENYLIGYKNAFIVVSHDRMFLDKTVSKVYEIEYGETKCYNGNYTSFTIQKQQDYDKALKDAILKQKEIARLSALVERFRYKPTKARMAQSKIKLLSKMGPAEVPFAFDTTAFRAGFTPDEKSVEKALWLNKLVFGYDRPLGEIDTLIKRGEKLGIIGRNGTGKSTLIKTIMGIIPAISGDIKKGLHVNIGYFDQTMTQNYSPLTVLEDFQNSFPGLSNGECRSSLASFLFTGEDVFKIVGNLSGGEKVRLALCKIFKKKPNLLILDEPTNHMDIIGKNALENMLKEYSGTVITVSHDRYFVDRVCTRLAVFDGSGLSLYPYTYAEYEKIKPKPDMTESAEKVEEVKPKKVRFVSNEKEKNKKLHRIAVLEEKIDLLEKEKEQLNAEFENDPSLYADYKKVEELNQKEKELDDKIEPLVAEWTVLSEEVEQM